MPIILTGPVGGSQHQNNQNLPSFWTDPASYGNLGIQTIYNPGQTNITPWLLDTANPGGSKLTLEFILLSALVLIYLTLIVVRCFK